MRKPPRILVVDDESGMLRAVERVLGTTHRVVGIQSSVQAVALAAEFKPDLVILDVRMPEIDGFELMARLKSTAPGAGHHPDDRQHRRHGPEADSRAPRPRVLLHSEAVRSRGAADARRALPRAALAARGKSAAHAAARAGARGSARVSAGAAARPRPGDRSPRDLLPLRVLLGARGRSVRLHHDWLGGRAALIVADVVGHGVSAAMLTGVVKSSFRASDADGYDPAAVVQRVRSNLSAFGPERFVTLVAAVLEADEGRLRYVNAGHPAGLLRNADGTMQRLTSTGPLVSPALPPCIWEQETVSMAPGDQLLLYTDGISDTLAGDQDLGDEQLVASIEKHPRGRTAVCSTRSCRRSDRTARRPPAAGRSHAPHREVATGAPARQRGESQKKTGELTSCSEARQRDPALSRSKISSSLAASSSWPVRWYARASR